MTRGEKWEEGREVLISLTADIVAAYVSNNACRGIEVPDLIRDVYEALELAGRREEPELVEVELVAEKPKPAINPKRSVEDDYIVCLEDGRRFKSLKRHLMTHYNMTPDQYREKWGLAADYPMVAPNYAKERSRLARATGLGQKRAGKRSTK